MKTIVGISIWVWTIWWSIIQVSSITKSSMILQLATNHSITQINNLGYTTLTLDLEEPTTENYLALIIALRAALRGDRLICGLPVLRDTAEPDERFVLVNLDITPTIQVTLAIDILDVYVVGYLDRYNNQYRANLLTDIPDLAQTHLFPEAVIRRRVPYTGHYRALEGQGGDRAKIPLGLNKLKAAAKAVYGMEPVASRAKDEAGFFLIAVQMISEAARFKYIARQIRVTHPYDSVLPNPKVLELENSWGPLSKAIVGSADCVELLRPVVMSDEHYNQWTVTRVDEIFGDLGIIKNIVRAVSQVEIS